MNTATRLLNQRKDDTITVVDLASSTPTRKRRRNSSALGLIIATVAAIGAVLLSSASPAGVAVIDAIYRCGFAFTVTWFAARSRRWTWAVIAGVAALTAANLFLQIVALVALGVAGWSILSSHRTRWIGAGIAAVSVVILLLQGQGPLWRLTFGWVDDPFGSSAACTALAVAPILRSGWKTISRKRRAELRVFRKRVGLVLGIIVFLSGSISLLALRPLQNGLAETRVAAELAGAGELDRASAAFERANHHWDRANRTLSGPWMVPSRLVPILGQHVRAAQVASGQASAITDAATVVTGRVDPGALIDSGALNVAEVDSILPTIDAFAATVDRASQRIEEVDSTWLIPPVAASIDRAQAILHPAAGVVGASAEALHVIDELVGGPTPSETLIMFSTPAEARGLGGFIGNWAVVTGTQGRLAITEQYRSRELNDLLVAQHGELRGSPDYVGRYGRFDIERHIQDVTISPDFPSVAAVTADLFAQATGTSVDAVLLVDPFVLQRLLEFTGPVESAGQTGLSVSASSVLNELFVAQYERFEDDDENREVELGSLTNALVAALFDSPPDPVAFATDLAPLADQDRLLLWLRSDTDGETVRRLGLDGAFPTTNGDLLALVHQNSGQNKIDSFLTRRMDISTTLDRNEHEVTHEVTISLENAAPERGLPDAIIGSNDQGIPPGTNAMMLTLYSKLPVVSATIEGVGVPLERSTEFGVEATSFFLSVPSQRHLALDITLKGTVDLESGYRTVLGAQPLVNADHASWEIRTRQGTRINPASAEWDRTNVGIVWDARVEKDRTFDFSFGD